MIKFNINLVVLNFQLVVLPNLTKSQLSPTAKIDYESLIILHLSSEFQKSYFTAQ